MSMDWSQERSIDWLQEMLIGVGHNSWCHLLGLKIKYAGHLYVCPYASQFDLGASGS